MVEGQWWRGSGRGAVGRGSREGQWGGAVGGAVAEGEWGGAVAEGEWGGAVGRGSGEGQWRRVKFTSNKASAVTGESHLPTLDCRTPKRRMSGQCLRGKLNNWWTSSK